MTYIEGDKLISYNGEEIPCRTREDIDRVIDGGDIDITTAFFTAKMGNTELLKYILEKMAGSMRMDYDMMIYYASMGRHLDTIEYIFQRASMAEYHISWNWVIQGAAIGGHLDLVKDYEQRALINDENIDWDFVLMDADDIQIIKYMCEKILNEGKKIPKDILVKKLKYGRCNNAGELEEYLKKF